MPAHPPPAPRPDDHQQDDRQQDDHQQDDRLAARYGRTRRRAPWYAVAGGALAGLALIAYLVWVALHYSYDSPQGQVQRFRIVDDRSATAEVEVVKRPGTTATCTAVAKSTDFGVVGHVTFQVPSGTARSYDVPVRIATTSLATTVDVSACSVVR